MCVWWCINEGRRLSSARLHYQPFNHMEQEGSRSNSLFLGDMISIVDGESRWSYICARADAWGRGSAFWIHDDAVSMQRYETPSLSLSLSLSLSFSLSGMCGRDAQVCECVRVCVCDCVRVCVCMFISGNNVVGKSQCAPGRARVGCSAAVPGLYTTWSSFKSGDDRTVAQHLPLVQLSLSSPRTI